MTMRIIPAQCNHASLISELALRSKAHWGYTAEFMAAVCAELTYSEASIRQHVTRLAWQENRLLGFYQLIEINATDIELEALFIEPELIGCGVGAKLFAHAVATAQAHKYHTISIQSDPYAAGFYSKQGCIKIGEKPSLSLPGRMLPLMIYELN